MQRLFAQGQSSRDNSELAFTDPLTGLGNHRRFSDKVDRLISDRAEDPAPFAVGIIDLDGFKPINDLFGHKAGDDILVHTPHSVIAGPYHRNVDGNLAALRALIGPLDAAEGIARGNGITLVALCRGNGETKALVGRAPDGLLAALAAGDVPGWLEAVPESRDRPVELFRVRNAP